MEPRLRELLDRMIGAPRDSTSASEKHEVVEMVEALEAELGKMVASGERRLPDATGWWARRYGGKVDWFRVEMTSDSGEPPLKPEIWIFGTFIEAERLSSPTTRWFGPFHVPKED